MKKFLLTIGFISVLSLDSSSFGATEEALDTENQRLAASYSGKGSLLVKSLLTTNRGLLDEGFNGSIKNVLRYIPLVTDPAISGLNVIRSAADLFKADEVAKEKGRAQLTIKTEKLNPFKPMRTWTFMSDTSLEGRNNNLRGYILGIWEIENQRQPAQNLVVRDIQEKLDQTRDSIEKQTSALSKFRELKTQAEEAITALKESATTVNLDAVHAFFDQLRIDRLADSTAYKASGVRTLAANLKSKEDALKEINSIATTLENEITKHSAQIKQEASTLSQFKISLEKLLDLSNDKSILFKVNKETGTTLNLASLGSSNPFVGDDPRTQQAAYAWNILSLYTQGYSADHYTALEGTPSSPKKKK